MISKTYLKQCKYNKPEVRKSTETYPDESKVYRMKMTPIAVADAHSWDEVYTICRVTNMYKDKSVKITADNFQDKWLPLMYFNYLLYSNYITVDL